MLRLSSCVLSGLVLLGSLPLAATDAKATEIPKASHVPKISHDLTFRPTVLIRKGNSQGSGTLIASKEGETLILTAAHVATADETGAIRIELHRYNLGVEKSLPGDGWPLLLSVELVAADSVGDVALLKLVGRPPLPFVAKLASRDEEPKRGSSVVSVGIDGGASLTSWPSQIQETAAFSLDTSGKGDPELVINKADREFLLTARAPEHGRSGGGLYSEAGVLVGVCVGRIEMEKKEQHAQGLFAASESVRRLLRENHLEDALVQKVRSTRTKGQTLTPTRSETRSR